MEEQSSIRERSGTDGIRTPKGEKTQNEPEMIFKEMMAENFPKLMKDIDSQIQGAH